MKKIFYLIILFSARTIQVNAQCRQYASVGFHTLAVKSNSTLWAWGYNIDGQSGDGTNTNKNIPVQIGADNDWAFIAEGGACSFAIKTNGALWAWAGISMASADRFIPVAGANRQ
jgi:alpha-tubulin suppressor-like RCC1 family protein